LKLGEENEMIALDRNSSTERAGNDAIALHNIRIELKQA